MTQLRITMVTVLVGAYLVGFGMLAGVVVDRCCSTSNDRRCWAATNEP